jgi:hypothetical protein
MYLLVYLVMGHGRDERSADFEVIDEQDGGREEH